MADKKDKTPMIEAVGLSKFYGPFAAVKDVSFEVFEGELVAFLETLTENHPKKLANDIQHSSVSTPVPKEDRTRE